MRTIRTYSELITLPTFEDRYEYLKLNGKIFFQYKSTTAQKWKSVRDKVIIRDNGCDLSMEGYEIWGKIIIHHMNPITIEDIERESDFVFNPEYLISTSLNTHNAIHYGDENLLIKTPIERTKYDTCPWR